MTDYEFEQLQRKIYKKKFELIELQKIYRYETGRDYMISGTVPEPDTTEYVKVY